MFLSSGDSINASSSKNEVLHTWPSHTDFWESVKKQPLNMQQEQQYQEEQHQEQQHQEQQFLVVHGAGYLPNHLC